MTHTLEDLDKIELFSVTAWKTADGWTLGTQRRAGDLVKYVNKRTLSEAIASFLASPSLPPLPYQ